MPRVGQVVLPEYPHHIVQRGHNRQVVFAQDEDCVGYLENLRELKMTFGIGGYAYCSMTNHAHLLLQPGDAIADLGRFMKALSARTARYSNRLEGRSGTLWESRYKSSPVQTDPYLLACCRYYRAQSRPCTYDSAPWRIQRRGSGKPSKKNNGAWMGNK